MNARDGMRGLRAERRQYHLCLMCGKPLESDYERMNCPECLAQQRQYWKKSKEKMKGAQRSEKKSSLP